MRKLLTLLAIALFYSALSFGQTKTVTGKVTDDKGGPIPFATVKVKGGKVLGTTDAKGDFSITVGSEKTLEVSSAGFSTQDVSIDGVSVVAVKLIGSVMEEVIVTAGGLKTKRKELGSATTQIKADQLTAGKATNVANGLQGKVAGFQISGTGGGVNPSYRLVLRGQRSLTGNNQALVVLDNVVVPTSVLSNLNPEDVEDIVVLNGAGAAALYGSQASNGAVIVTTKKGRKGVISIGVSNTVTIEEVAFFPKIQKRFGAGGTAYGLDEDGNPSPNYLENQSYGAAFDGIKRPLGPALEDGTQDSAVYSYNDGHFKFWKRGVTNQTDFNVSSGDENSSFYLSGQYLTAKGTTPGDKYNRANVRINGTRKLGNKLMFTYSSSYTQNRYDITSQTGNMYGNMLNMPSNVDITKYKNWRTDPFANPNGYYNPWYQNPYFTADNYRTKQRNDYLTANVELKYTPIAGLDIIARQGIATRNYSEKATVGAFNYTDYAEHTEASAKSDIAASVSDGTLYTTNLLTDFLVQYQRRISDFSLNVIGGAQHNQNQAKYLNVTANGLVIPDLYNISNGVGTPTVGEATFLTRQVGVYGKATIGYKDVVFLTGTARNDWDSRLAKDNQSFFYPSLEAAVVLSDAFDFIKDSKAISYLKLRGGWSKTGQVNLGNTTNFGAYSLLPTFSQANGFPYGANAGYGLDNSLVSNDLRPEITKGYEFGFDLNLFNDRFVSSVTWYDTKTDNQTVSTEVSRTTGFQYLLTNTGQTQSRGIEATAHFTPLRTADWTVTFGGNYTYLENNVNFISADLPSLFLSSTGSGSSYAVAGQSFPVIMGFDYKRDPQGRVIVNGTSGLPTKTDAIGVLGNATPKNRLGLDLAVRYKSFRLSVLVEHRGGYEVFNSMGPEMDWSGTGYRTAVYDRTSFVYPNSVIEDPSKPGTYIPNTSVVIANGNGNNGFWSDGINRDVTSNYVTSGDFWKLRELSLSYEVPVNALRKTKVIKGATISVQGRNLFLWMAKDNLYTDPEYSTGGVDNNGVGITGLNTSPPSRFYGATLSLKF